MYSTKVKFGRPGSMVLPGHLTDPLILEDQQMAEKKYIKEKSVRRPGNRRTHGDSGTTEYRTYSAMLARCYNPNVRNYESYGGRGITVCERWLHSFENFLADIGRRPPGLSLDRINNDGNYGPENCRWATLREQNQNTRTNKFLTFKGETLPQVEWERRMGLSRGLLCARIADGWSVERAITAPMRKVSRGGKALPWKMFKRTL